MSKVDILKLICLEESEKIKREEKYKNSASFFNLIVCISLRMIVASYHLIVDELKLIGGFESIELLFGYDFLIILSCYYCLCNYRPVLL